MRLSIDTLAHIWRCIFHWLIFGFSVRLAPKLKKIRARNKALVYGYSKFRALTVRSFRQFCMGGTLQSLAACLKMQSWTTEHVTALITADQVVAGDENEGLERLSQYLHHPATDPLCVVISTVMARSSY